MTTPNCRGSDTELFYDSFRWPEAKKICKGCPVLIACRKEFLKDDYAYAGGMTPAQRGRWWVRQDEYVPKARTAESNRKITEETKLEVLRLFDDDGLSMDAIAKTAGISKSAARRILQANGRSRSKDEQLALRRSHGDRTREWVLKLLAEKIYTLGEVAEKVGVSYRHVADIRRNHVPIHDFPEDE